VEDDRTSEADETALERLRRRYAEGELTASGSNANWSDY
jgi:uncharacterized membrane protein